MARRGVGGGRRQRLPRVRPAGGRARPAHREGWGGLALAVLLLSLPFACPVRAATPTKADFDFGHQLGYLYAWTEPAYGWPAGTWWFRTGLRYYATPTLPEVTLPRYRRFERLQVPGTLVYAPATGVEVRIDTDLVAEGPPWWLRGTGGNAPRFRTRLRLLAEGGAPLELWAVVGVKFSSAKPWEVWAGRFDRTRGRGLTGVGTGIADYWLALEASRRLAPSAWLHARLGLAPLGDPTAGARVASQADELLFGLLYERWPAERWGWSLGVTGMWGALPGLRNDDYALATAGWTWRGAGWWASWRLARGLTPASDTWVVGWTVALAWWRSGRGHHDEVASPARRLP